jgi:hypothetical protein
MNDTASEAAIQARDAILRASEHIGHKLQQLTEVVEELRQNLMYAMPHASHPLYQEPRCEIARLIISPIRPHVDSRRRSGRPSGDDDSPSVGTDHDDQMLDQSCVERRVPRTRYLDQETGDESAVEVQREKTHG